MNNGLIDDITKRFTYLAFGADGISHITFLSPFAGKRALKFLEPGG